MKAQRELFLIQSWMNQIHFYSLNHGVSKAATDLFHPKPSHPVEQPRIPIRYTTITVLNLIYRFPVAHAKIFRFTRRSDCCLLNDLQDKLIFFRNTIQWQLDC
jgi:hypothetical protein